MFRKVATVVGLLALAVGGYFLYGKYNEVTERHDRFWAKVDTLHREVLGYHEYSKVEAQTIAAALAAPYYLKMREYKAAIMPYEWTCDHALWNHSVVIRRVSFSSPQMRHQPNEVQYSYIRRSTPEHVILELHTANQNMEELLRKFRWRDFRSEESLEEARQLFAARKSAMKEALTAANRWRQHVSI